MKKLSHLNRAGDATMVDVTQKQILLREALAAGEIRLQATTLELIQTDGIPKGNVFATARLAGIQAAKRTGELIPLCHPLPITHCEVRFRIPAARDRILIEATAKIAAQTGVEMEALTAVSIAALTIYDMCKAVDKAMVIGEIYLVRKTKLPWTQASPHGQKSPSTSSPMPKKTKKNFRNTVDRS
ncbi:MAG: cyclic pyranopterin monophosphate synthase MoaC [Verrucomicrobiales bacterium]|nr:cyclic pyranopterin monophosphate synthase MoaC [Verrucomicrobiales bacterium]